MNFIESIIHILAHNKHILFDNANQTTSIESICKLTFKRNKIYSSSQKSNIRRRSLVANLKIVMLKELTDVTIKFSRHVKWHTCNDVGAKISSHQKLLLSGGDIVFSAIEFRIYDLHFAKCGTKPNMHMYL